MQNKERFKIIPSVYNFFIKDGKILLSRRFNTGYEDGNYSLPAAGHGEEGETLREGTTREALEETGIRIDVEDLEFALIMHRYCPDKDNPHARLDFFFLVKSWHGEIKNMEPDKCDDLTWFPLDNLPQNTIPYIRKAIECYRQGINYCEFGWENKNG